MSRSLLSTNVLQHNHKSAEKHLIKSAERTASNQLANIEVKPYE